MGTLDSLNRYVFWALIVVAVIPFIVFVLMFIPLNTSKVAPPHRYEELVNLYQEVRSVRLSDENRPKMEQIIHDRLNCYGLAKSFREKTVECNSQYVSDIVKFSRKNIRSNPMLGRFLTHIEFCPIAHSICFGTESLSSDQCVVVENQCIEFMLDTYWRGNGSVYVFD